jgi:ribonuclease HI
MNTTKVNENDTVYVFTDGACSKNGRKNSSAGIGVFFNAFDSRNVSEELTDSVKRFFKNDEVSSKPTNNKAELMAILRALYILQDELENKKLVKVYTDSMYSIRCLTTWYKNWEKNGWVNAKGKSVLNKEIIQTILKFMRKFENQISFAYVKAHTSPKITQASEEEYVKWFGNNNADLLARQAVYAE